MCPTHSEAKQTKMSRVWSLEQRKVYCRAMLGERVASAQKTPELPETFQQSLFKGQVMERPSVCDQLMHNSLIG